MPSPNRRGSPRQRGVVWRCANRVCTESSPRRMSEPSITSSCTSANVCTSSSAAAASTTRGIATVAVGAHERAVAERRPKPLAARSTRTCAAPRWVRPDARRPRSNASSSAASRSSIRRSTRVANGIERRREDRLLRPGRGHPRTVVGGGRRDRNACRLRCGGARVPVGEVAARARSRRCGRRTPVSGGRTDRDRAGRRRGPRAGRGPVPPAGRGGRRAASAGAAMHRRRPTCG